MFQIVTPKGKFGPFRSIEVQQDGYIADGGSYQFSVVGAGTIEPYDGFIPVSQDSIDAALVAEKSRRISDVREKRDAVEQAGSNGFDTDIKAIVRMLAATTGLKKAGANAKVSWTKQDGGKVDLKADDIDNVLLGAVARADAVHERARQLIEQINAATTVAQVAAINIETGWPA